MFFLCLVFLMLSRLFITGLGSPAGKGLTAWFLLVMFIVFVNFPCGILEQMCYLSISFPELCCLSNFYCLLYVMLLILFLYTILRV